MRRKFHLMTVNALVLDPETEIVYPKTYTIEPTRKDKLALARCKVQENKYEVIKVKEKDEYVAIYDFDFDEFEKIATRVLTDDQFEEITPN